MSEYKFDLLVIGSGLRPYRPADVDFNHPAVFDSDTILSMPHTPRKLIIYGAGVIGCEYASIFSARGVKVDLVNTRSQLLSYLDDEISDALSYHLAEATEIIHIGQAIMKQSGTANNIRYFISTTFNYPTMAEAYRIAALNGLNRLTRF